MDAQNPVQTKAPVYTHRDGSVFAKIWENQSSEGRTFHTVTFGKLYKDAQGHAQETQGFTGVEILKVQQLSHEAYRTIQRIRELQAPQQNGLQAQRDQAMSKATPAHGNGVADPDHLPGHTPSE